MTNPRIPLTLLILGVFALLLSSPHVLAKPDSSVVLRNFAEDYSGLPEEMSVGGARGTWEIRDGWLQAAKVGGPGETLLVDQAMPTLNEDGHSFELSTDAANLSRNRGHSFGLAFHVQPNGDRYVLGFNSRGEIQLERRTGDESKVLGTSKTSAQLEMGRFYRLTVRSDAPGVFHWAIRSEGVRPTEGTMTDGENPLKAGFGALSTNAPANDGNMVSIFSNIRFSAGGSADERSLPSLKSGAEILDERIARAAAEDQKQPDNVTSWILTWVRDPSTTQMIDWHQAGPNAQTPMPFAWRKVGAEDWTSSPPDITLPFPFSSRFVHRIELSGLDPDTFYEFRIGEMEPLRFQTLPKTLEKPLQIAFGGDMMGDARVYEEINRRVAEADARFVVWGGDLAYADGLPQNVRRWFRYLEIMSRSLLTEDRRVLPVVVGIGNHEVRGGYWHRTELADHPHPWTDEMRTLVAPFFYGLWAFPGHPGYGFLDLGDYATLIVLDSDHTTPVEGLQTAWLENVLKERKDSRHLLPVYHVPAYPSVRPFDGRTSVSIRQHWVPLFEQAGVRIAFEHHDHAYKRTHSLLQNKRDERGIVYVGDGAWGVGLRDPATDRDYMATVAKKHHAFLIELHPDRIEGRAMDPKGEIFDQFTIPVTGN